MDSDDLTEVAYTNDQAEAGMIQGLLESDGIPSILKGIGIDGPRLGFGTLATSPQRVMVRSSQAEEARALLADTLIENEQDAMPDSANPEPPISA